jgi:hypothetical protein
MDPGSAAVEREAGWFILFVWFVLFIW